MVIGGHVNLGMIAILGVLIELVLITVYGVLDFMPLFCFLGTVVGLEEKAAVPLVRAAVLPPDHADPFPVRLVTRVLLKYQPRFKLAEGEHLLTCLK